MTARSIGETLGFARRTKARRTHQPVRSNSYHAGEREKRFWRPVSRIEASAVIRAAEEHNLATKAAGKRNGALGHIALEVLREMFRLVSYGSGRLEPAIATLQARLRRSRSAVIRALAALKREGFLEWIRRTEPIDNAEGVGPRVRQITNAYRFGWGPKAARALIQRLMARSVHLARQIAARPPSPPPATPEAREMTPALRDSLLRLGRAIDERESSKGSESRLTVEV